MSRLFARLFALVIALFACSNVMALRDDVLIVVNNNSLDSPVLGAYYARSRGIDPANIVHVRVPDSYFISWNEFRRLRDQLIRFMQLTTLDDPALVTRWREAAVAGAETQRPLSAAERRELQHARKKTHQLEKELRRKEKALAEVAALLVLQKKAQAIWGDGEDD